MRRRLPAGWSGYIAARVGRGYHDRAAAFRPPEPAAVTASHLQTASLTFTGERFLPEVRGAIWYEHWHRYAAVAPLARGKRVLDAACGEGYGSFLLAQPAQRVIGVDVAPEAIAHAGAALCGAQPALRRRAR